MTTLPEYDHKPDSFSWPSYTTLPPVKDGMPADFSMALPIFLAEYPEFSSSRNRLEILNYCFKYYSNFDPEIRGLPILEKLEHAGNMAKNFFGSVTGDRL
jgi:hypothetical protein